MTSAPGTPRYALLFFFAGVTLLTYINRSPVGDDAWFAEQSFWFLKEGKIRSEYFRGLHGWENQLLVSHKLFLWCGALLMAVFGTQLPVVQFMGLIFFLILVGLIVVYIRNEEGTLRSTLLVAVLILIFSNRLLVKMSFQNRPEMMLAAMGFGSYLLLFTGRPAPLKTVLAGILAGLAVLAHLNGVIFLLAGAVTLIRTKQYKRTALFSMAGILAASLYFADILKAPDGLSVWYYQFTHDPAASHGLDPGRKLVQLLTYPRLFFHTPEQIALSVLFLFVVWRLRRFIPALPADLKTYFLTLFCAFWIITKSNSGMYMILFIPLMLVILYELFRKAPFMDRPFRIILAGYFVVGLFGMGQLIYRNAVFGYMPESYSKLRNYVESDDTGLVPLPFFFNDYARYHRLLTHENYKLQFGKKNLSPSQMSHWASNNGADFILYDYRYLTESFYPKAGTLILSPYKLAFYDGRFAIYKRITKPSRR